MILAFLQNMWVRDPERIKRDIAKYGEELRMRYIEYALFAGCKTGRMLKKAFGEELIEQITFEETTREIAGDPKTIFPADLAHIRQCLEHHKPRVVLTFGQIAHDAVQPLVGPIRHIHAHHPASRHPGSFNTLMLAAADLRKFLGEAEP